MPGVDRDSRDLTNPFDQRNPAVKRMIAELIQAAHAAGAKVGICGQVSSDYGVRDVASGAGINPISPNLRLLRATVLVVGK